MWGREEEEEEEEEADRVGHAQASWEMCGSKEGKAMSCLPGAATHRRSSVWGGA